MNDRYDIVVIGSGVGGMVSAALLSSLGKRVLIIEKEPKPGGYLTEFKSEDFVFDVSLHLLNGCGPGGYAAQVFDRCGISRSIKFLKPKYLYRSIFPDFDVRVPQRDIGAYKDTLKKLFPNKASSIDAVIDDMRTVFEATGAYGKRRNLSAVAAHIAKDYDSIVSQHIDDPKLKALICQMWIYFGLPPSMLRGIDFSYPCFDYLNHGGYYLEKGSYEIVRALERRIKGAGGKFLFNKSVGRISIKDDNYQRVSFGKEEVLCDTIISNIDLTRTVYELMGTRRFTSGTLNKLSSITPSISAFEIFMGIDDDLKMKYPDDYEIFVNSSYDIGRQYQDCMKNNAAEAPFVITLNSNVNRFSAAPGKSVVTVIMLAGYKFWSSKSRGEYQDKKQRIADTLIDRAAKIIPELKTKLRRKIVSTPVTFERYTNNSEGAIYGYSRMSGSRAEVRPNDLKGLQNLYFASAWARQGSGVAKVLRAADDVYAKISAKTLEKMVR